MSRSYRTIVALCFLVGLASLVGAWTIKETKTDQDLDFYVAPGGTPTKALSIDGATGSSEIDGSSDTVQLNIKGHTTQTNSVSPLLRLQGGGAYIPDLWITRSATDVDSPSAPISGNSVGAITFKGYDGNSYEESASIRSLVDGTPGDGDMPGSLAFSTTPDGTATRVERMRIDNAGNVGIGTTSPAGLTHISRAVSAGDVKLIIENSQGTGSTTERAVLELKPSQTLSVHGAQVRAVRDDNFVANPAGRDVGLEFVVVPNDNPSVAMKINNTGGAIIYDTGNNGGNVPHACNRVVGTPVNNQTSTVSCAAGEKVIGGGCQSDLPNSPLSRSYPSNDTTWTCVYTTSVNSNIATAICCDY